VRYKALAGDKQGRVADHLSMGQDKERMPGILVG